MLKNIAKRQLFILFVIIFSLGFYSCQKTIEKAEEFSIISDEVYYIDLEPIKLSVDNDYVLKDKSIINVTFSFIENSCNGRLEKGSNGTWYFSASSIGNATIEATIDGLKSKNNISITSIYSNDKIVQNLVDVLNTDGGITFGQTYDLGIAGFDANKYSVRGADEILKINDSGKLEVCGIGHGTIELMYNNSSIFDGKYTVYNSTLATKIKEELISQGKITSKSDSVTNCLLKDIVSLDMRGQLINDPSSSMGIKYLVNLKEIDLSSNGLKDISFMSSLCNLESIILKNNQITDLSDIANNEHIKKLDLSNNRLNKITNLQYLYELESLDLSSNNITDISPLSSAYSLKKLVLNNNKLSNFKDSLSGLENLEELSLGNCGINFTDVISLRYLPNVEHLDISGTKPYIKDIVATLKKLKTLKLSGCYLDRLEGDDSLKYLNQLRSLEVLDISNNNLNLVDWFQSENTPYLEGDLLSELKELYLGGNAFNSIPDLSKFRNLKLLDLNSSNNLTDVSSLSTLNIETLILDNCNSISGESLSILLKQNDAFKNLSTIGAFNYLDKTNYDFLVSAVSEGRLSWKFFTDTWATKDSIANYTKTIYFSMDEFLQKGIDDSISVPKNRDYTVKYDGNPEIIISFVNDLDSLAKTHYLFNIPKEILSIQLYGNKYYTYDITFNVLERKEASIAFNLYNFKDRVSEKNGDAIIAAPGSELILTACDGENVIQGGKGEIKFREDQRWITDAGAGLNVYDLVIDTLNTSSILINGGAGGNASDRDAVFLSGVDGTPGANAVNCHNCELLSNSISIQGGNGGKGGKKGSLSTGKNGKYGNGGNGIVYSGALLSEFKPSINGGEGDKDGNPTKYNK